MIVNQQLITSTEGDAFRIRRERGSGVSTNVDGEKHTKYISIYSVSLPVIWCCFFILGGGGGPFFSSTT